MLEVLPHLNTLDLSLMQEQLYRLEKNAVNNEILKQYNYF